MKKVPKKRKVTTEDQSQAEEFNFTQYKKAVLADPRARKIIEDFLKYRHRE